jgi:tetratricopeptide (TPR) repeat protein
MIPIRGLTLPLTLALCAGLSVISPLVLSPLVLAQSSNPAETPVPRLVVIEEPLVLDGRLADKGVTPQSFAETLRFVISTAAGVTATIGSGDPRSGQRTLRLSSKIDRFQESTIWTGEAREPMWGSVVLGPVVIIDEKGLRFGALSEISALVRAQFTRSLNSGNSASLSLDCLKSTSQPESPLRQDIIYQFRARLERVPGLRGQRLVSDQCSAQDTDQSVFRIEGSIEVNEQLVSIEPQISWQALRIPLAQYRGAPIRFQNDRDEYLNMLVEGFAAIINEYPQEVAAIASDFRNSEPAVLADQGLKFLGGNTPYLALPFLQRAANDNPGLYYELGVTFKTVSAPRQSETAFRLSIASNSQHGLAHRELGIILFGQGKYEEAAREFELAGNTSGVAEKYAPLLYLLGRRDAARNVAATALARGERSIDLQLLLARLDIRERKAKDAIERLAVILQDGQDDRAVKLLKEAAATTLQRRDYVSAESALSVLRDKAPDPEVYMLSGRVAVAKSADNEFSDTNKAVEFFGKALREKKSKNPENPELDLVVLDLAEALLFDGQYGPSASRAQSFLTAQSAAEQENSDLDNRITTNRYVPVAALLVAASQYLSKPPTMPMPIENAMRFVDRWVGKTSKKPELTVWIPVPGTDGLTPITVARWSFDTFGRYTCTQLSSKRREEILKLTNYVEDKIGVEPPTSCQPTR